MAMVSRTEIGAMTTRLVILLMLFAIFFGIGRVRGETLDVAELQVQRWRETFPEVAMPQAFAGQLSPLTLTQLHHFSTLLKANQTLNATQLCKAADLSCREDIPIILARVLAFFNHLSADEKDMFVDAAELKEGGQITMPDMYPPVTWKSFMPLELADLLPPLSVGNFARISRLLDIPRDSNMSRNMLDTLEACEGRLEGEGESAKCCASVECMVEHVASFFGSDVELVMDTSLVGSGQRAKVRAIKKRENISGKSNMACHNLAFPYAVMYCHQINGSDTFEMELEVVHNEKSVLRNASAVCHYLSHGGVGKEAVCHLLYGSLLEWLPKTKHQ
uniref:TSA: Wollemia nobilis Ref_Wollemi_Transcript_7052_1207 transcribed RNA sequence n=1 Tax=Wollemia nobilis TaxID=56998 RepID=A0A0C9QV95_9CONI